MSETRVLPARILLFYFVLSLLPFSVMLLNALDLPLMFPRGDLATTLWNFWWFDQTFWHGQNPYNCPEIFHPFGAYLYLHTFEVVDALVTTPFRLVGGVSLAWKVAALLHFFWTAVAAHLLARRLGIAQTGAVLCAVILCSSSFRINSIQALSVQATGHALFLAWAAAGCWLEPDRVRHGAWLGFAAVLLLFSNLYYLFFSALFLGAAAIFLAATVRPDRSLYRGWLKQLAIALAVGILPLLFMARGIVRAGEHLGTVGGYELWNQVRGSSDVLQLILPSWIRAMITGDAIPPDAYLANWVPLRAISFAPPTILVLLAILGLRSGGCAELRPSVRRGLIVVAVLAFVVALGPRVKIWTTLDPADVPVELSDGTIPRWEGISVPSPYALLAQLPVFRHIRGNMRAGYFFFAAVVLLLANPADCYINKLRECLQAKRLLAMGVLPLVLVIVWWEHRVPLLASQPMERVEPFAMLRDDPSPGATRIFPGTGYVVQGTAMYFQTIHGRPVIGGYLSRDLAGYEQWLASREWNFYFSSLSRGNWAPLNEEGRRKFVAQAVEDGMRYVIIIRPYMNDDERRVNYFKRAFQEYELGELIWDDDFTTVFKLNWPEEAEERFTPPREISSPGE